MSVTRPVVKTETLGKNKNQTSLGISLPLESGQRERWYFHLGASNPISVRPTQSPNNQVALTTEKCSAWCHSASPLGID